MSVRTLTCPLPAEINPLSPAGYLFSIAKLPELKYFCQQVNLPAIMNTPSEFATPLVMVPVPGQNIEFQPLRVDFLVDSKMSNYKAIYNWLKGIGFPEANTDYTSFVGNSTTSDLEVGDTAALLSDATLVILDNNNNPTATVSFIDCYPVALESLQFQSNIDDIQYLAGSVTFNYTYFKFI